EQRVEHQPAHPEPYPSASPLPPCCHCRPPAPVHQPCQRTPPTGDDFAEMGGSDQVTPPEGARHEQQGRRLDLHLGGRLSSVRTTTPARGSASASWGGACTTRPAAGAGPTPSAVPWSCSPIASRTSPTRPRDSSSSTTSRRRWRGRAS